MTASTTNPTLAEVCANVRNGTRKFKQRIVREQLGGRQDYGASLKDYAGIACGQYSSLTGSWNTTPSNNGYMYKGYDNVAAQLNDDWEINIISGNHPDDGYPVKGTQLKARMRGAGGGDAIHEVRWATQITKGGTYKLTFSKTGTGNGYYSYKTYAQWAVASSSSNYLQGNVNLDFFTEQEVNRMKKNWVDVSYDVTLTTSRPYVTVLFYLKQKDGGSPTKHDEAATWNLRLVKA